MSNQERDPNAEVQKEALLLLKRGSINQPPKPAIEAMLRGIEQTLLPGRLRQAQEALDQARTAKETVRSFNALVLTVNILEAIENGSDAHFNTLSLQTQEDRATFAVFFDTTVGMSLVSTALRDAVDEIAGDLETKVVQKEDQIVDLLNPDPLTQTSLHFSSGQIHRKVRRFAELLKEDPSGFSVVDAIVEEVAGLPVLSPFAKEWLVAGARIAQQIYKTIYPQAQELLRPFA